MVLYCVEVVSRDRIRLPCLSQDHPIHSNSTYWSDQNEEQRTNTLLWQRDCKGIFGVSRCCLLLLPLGIRAPRLLQQDGHDHEAETYDSDCNGSKI